MLVLLSNIKFLMSCTVLRLVDACYHVEKKIGHNPLTIIPFTLIMHTITFILPPTQLHAYTTFHMVKVTSRFKEVGLNSDTRNLLSLKLLLLREAALTKVTTIQIILHATAPLQCHITSNSHSGLRSSRCSSCREALGTVGESTK